MYSLDLPIILQGFPSERLNEIRIFVSCTNALCLVVFGLFHISITDIYICCNWGNRSKAEANKNKTANLGQKRCELFPGILLTSKYIFRILLLIRTRTSFLVGSGLLGYLIPLVNSACYC